MAIRISGTEILEEGEHVKGSGKVGDHAEATLRARELLKKPDRSKVATKSSRAKGGSNDSQ